MICQCREIVTLWYDIGYWLLKTSTCEAVILDKNDLIAVT